MAQSAHREELAAGLPALQDRAVGAILDATAHLLGMEVVFVGALTEGAFTFARIRGQAEDPDWAELTEGSSWPRTDSMCDRLLAGAPPRTHDAAGEPMYADVPARLRLGITSYVGVPVRSGSGQVIGTLCGIDRRPVPVDDEGFAVLSDLADALSAHLADAAMRGVVIRRTPQGWRVAQSEEEDLSTAMTLADLLTPELTPPGRPPAGPEEADRSELDRLRTAVDQLEHALAARVVIEQAIGVLAERQHVTARAAFEKLRAVARRTGRKVFALSQEVVASATEPGRPLPAELGPPAGTGTAPMARPVPRPPRPGPGPGRP